MVCNFAKVVIIVIPLASFPGKAACASWSVQPDGSGDAPTLLAAVDSASSGDTLTLGNGVFAGYGNRNVPWDGKALFVRSASGDAAACVIDCGGVGRAFIVDHREGAQGGIEGITIRNGFGNDGGGAVRLSGGGGAAAMNFAVRNCRFEENTAGGDGGAIEALSDFDLVVERSDFRGNRSELGYFTWAGGGAISMKSNGLHGRLTMKESVVDSNFADGPAGGIYVSNASVDFYSCEVNRNVSGLDSVLAWPAGAGLQVLRQWSDSPEMQVSISSCAFIGNVGIADKLDGVAGDGGGVLVHGFDRNHRIETYVRDTEFRENYAVQGAGIYVGRYTTGLVQRCRFVGNTALHKGGASFKGGKFNTCIGEWARYEFCEFRDNRAGFDREGAPAFSGARGGACAASLWPRAEFVNCTFLDNLVGGVDGRGDAFMHFDREGAFRADEQRCLLVNCLFYGAAANDVQVRADPDGFTEVSHCAWEPGEFQATGVTPSATVALDGSPFSGPGEIDIAPPSPCIDAGVFVDSTIDLERTPVPQNGMTDIGALEWVYFTGIGVGDPPGNGLPAPPVKMQVFPNPFNPRTVVRVDLPSRAFVRLEVLDLSGRRLATLVDRPLEAGLHLVPWEGRDASGRAVASGVYCARLTAGGATLGRKVILLR